MYSVNGDFGQVRIASLLPNERSKGLFSLNLVGWHRCNEQYQINHPKGRTEHLLLFTIDGCGSMEVSDRKYTLTPGTVALIPRFTSGSYKTPPGSIWEFYWMHPHGDLADIFLDSVAQNGILKKAFDPTHRYAERIERLMEQCREPAPDDLQISSQVGELLHLVAADLEQKPRRMSLSARAIMHIEQNFQMSISVEDIARQLFVSKEHLIRIFKKETGITPYQYLINYRLSSAVQLLKFSDLQIKEIASQVGFSSDSHFIDLFRQHFACTPVQYRFR